MYVFESLSTTRVVPSCVKAAMGLGIGPLGLGRHVRSRSLCLGLSVVDCYVAHTSHVLSQGVHVTVGVAQLSRIWGFAGADLRIPTIPVAGVMPSACCF